MLFSVNGFSAQLTLQPSVEKTIFMFGSHYYSTFKLTVEIPKDHEVHMQVIPPHSKLIAYYLANMM